MAVSYPGVYIQEVPSGVRTIVGVDTSVAAFVGYTQRGPTNEPVQLFSYADYERRFGGLDVDSPLSYAVRQFFLNGGGKAWIVRVALGAAAASVGLQRTVGAGSPVLTATAVSEGEWGNRLVLVVDYDTSSPGSTFNLTVQEWVEQNGAMAVARSEVHRNLSMNEFSGNYCVAAVNADSDLIQLQRATLAFTTQGAATSGVLVQSDVDAVEAIAGTDANSTTLNVSIDGAPPVEVRPDLTTVAAAGSFGTKMDAIALAIETALNTPTTVVSGSAAAGVLSFARTGPVDERSSIVFSNAGSKNVAALLKLGVVNGGREISGASVHRPVPSGSIGSRVTTFADQSAVASGEVDVTILDSNGTTVLPAVTLALWSAAPGPANLIQARAVLQQALAARSEPVLSSASVELVDDTLIVVPGGTTMSYRIGFSGGVSALLGLNAVTQNVKGYQLGIGPDVAAQDNAVPGGDGTPPTVTELEGSRSQKTGIYALEDADLFNILMLPDQSDTALLTAAVAYAKERRSFVIIDMPANVGTLDEARAWLQAPNTAAVIRDENVAAYFPRIRAADPLQNNRVRAFPNSGAIAGLYARTDGTRGVWKAPAGTEATLRGVQGLEYTLTDPENGVLNPLGLNSLRVFPAFGPVCWGARTRRGADQLADQWKYIPVRRLALFIEESLFRGTQWVVFEPNDEPLWAQIRLNIGAFMNNLFRQGAFQGSTPRDAYLVQCDRTTTTQDDINRGIVNILVGFAPLKPAEFVIIKLQQLAGQVQA
jgi:hypothetical protein